uniref:Secreted protein n=1 Tax=Rhipicephalus microplus TaxID=6941 RepID=A0A6G5A1Q2_RHIMP
MLITCFTLCLFHSFYCRLIKSFNDITVLTLAHRAANCTKFHRDAYIGIFSLAARSCSLLQTSPISPVLFLSNTNTKGTSFESVVQLAGKLSVFCYLKFTDRAIFPLQPRNVETVHISLPQICFLCCSRTKLLRYYICRCGCY